MDELANFEPLYTTKSYGEPAFPPPMPQDVCTDLVKRSPVNATQMMAHAESTAHCLASNAETSTSRNYEADLANTKEDLANMFKAKLGLDMHRTCLYQRSYSDSFDLVPYLTV